MKSRPPILRCLTCGRFVQPREVRTLCFACPGSQRHYHSTLVHCGDHPHAGTVVWDREGVGIALNYGYVLRAFRDGGEAAVDALCDNPDPEYWPGATPGELALARSYHRKWREYVAVQPRAEVSLYG